MSVGPGNWMENAVSVWDLVQYKDGSVLQSNGDGFLKWLTEHERKIAERAWDEAINAMKYEDGTPVELVTNINPYRSQP